MSKFANLKKDYLCFLAIIKVFFKDKNFLKHFGFIFALYFIGIFKFLTTDFFYADDTLRLLKQEPQFERDGRFLSEFLSHIFHMDYPYLNYNSPLNQLIAIAFLSLASMALVKIVNKKITYFGLIASLCVGLSPFYLDCLAFKYDSPYMALATLCVILPFLFIKRLSLFFIVSVLFLLCMWNLYQANNGIYIVLSMFITLNLFLKNVNLKEIYKFIFISALAFIVSVLIYKFGFMPFRPEYAYIDDMIKEYSFDKININFFIFVLFLIDFLDNWIIISLFFVACILFFIKKILETKNKSYIFSLFFILAFLIIGFFASYGLLYLIPNSVNPRNFIGLGVFVAILLLTITNLKIKFVNLLSKIIIIIYSYNMILISNININMLEMYKNYVNFRINQIYSFIQNSEKYKNYKIMLPNFNAIGVTKPLVMASRKSTVATRHFHAFSHFSNNMYKLYGNDEVLRASDICSGDVKETLQTKFNTFDIYDNCVQVYYNQPDAFIYKTHFYRAILEKIPLIRDRKLDNEIEMSLHVAARIPFANTMTFGFSNNFSKIIKNNKNMEIVIYFKDKDETLKVNKNIKDFSKVGGKYYYVFGLANVRLSAIEKFVINIDDKIKYDVKWRDDL